MEKRKSNNTLNPQQQQQQRQHSQIKPKEIVFLSDPLAHTRSSLTFAFFQTFCFVRLTFSMLVANLHRAYVCVAVLVCACMRVYWILHDILLFCLYLFACCSFIFHLLFAPSLSLALAWMVTTHPLISVH